MSKSDFTITLLSKKSPESIFQKILDVRSWWSGIYSEKFSGSSEKINDVFTFEAGDGAHYTEQKLIELIPNEKIVWLVTQCNLSFIERNDEWVGTKLIFEITQNEENTEVKFTHQGLTNELDCYDNCAPAWTQYIQTKLFPLINE